MQIAVLIRPQEGLSLIRYRESVMRELQAQGALLLPFNESEQIPLGYDIVWDPGMGRNRHPLSAFRNLEQPVVITLHGSATFTMKWREVYSGLFEAIRDKWANLAAMREWAWFRNKVAAVIAVSRYGAREASLVYDIHPDLITPIYHGVDHTVFFPEKNLSDQIEPYFLHVSTFQPKKNVKRLIEAYEQLPVDTRPKLIVVSPGFKKKPQVAGLTVIDRSLNSPELAKLYNEALVFIFPSLHETFGLPIVEAMACGCPVITSFDTACAEVAGDAAMLVNPRSTGDIAQAMSRIINEPDLRSQLSQKGLTKASQFTWAETARLHMAVFRSVLNGYREEAGL
jgi:glycosyltransferase involved in cell wall biosynthesis